MACGPNKSLLSSLLHCFRCLAMMGERFSGLTASCRRHPEHGKLKEHLPAVSGRFVRFPGLCRGRVR
eukprot:14241684-Alexandrium_andersonii.AAC.1